MTEPSSKDAPPHAPAAASAGLLGVFFVPKRAFAGLRGAPKPLLLLAILVGSSLLPPVAFLSSGQVQPAIEKQMKRSGAYEKIPPEKRKEAMDTLVKVAKIAAPIGAASKRATFILVIAILCFAVLRGQRKELTFAQVASAVALACFPLLLKDALEALVFWVLGPQYVDLDNALPSNLAALIPLGKARVTAAALQTIDLFSIWVAALIGIGVNTVAQTKSKVPWMAGFGLLLLGGVARVAGALAG